MNVRDLRHTLIALAIQAATASWSGDWLAGAAAGAWFYVGREVAQAEYRGIQAFYDRKRANAPWHVGLQPRCWTFKSFWWDMTLPALVVGAVAILAALIP